MKRRDARTEKLGTYLRCQPPEREHTAPVRLNESHDLNVAPPAKTVVEGRWWHDEAIEDATLEGGRDPRVQLFDTIAEVVCGLDPR